MQINITRFKASMQRMDHADIKSMCSKFLKIDFQQLRSSLDNNMLTLEHLSPDKGKPCVVITTDRDIEHKDSRVLLDLKSPFFKTTTDFEIDKLLRFLNRYKHAVQQIDLTFVDDQRCLTAQEIAHWCKYSTDYCVGSLVKWASPEIVGTADQILRIKLGSPQSKTNYGVISIAPHTGEIRVKISVKKKEKIRYVLGDHNSAENEHQSRCLELLVSSFDIITASSKKSRFKAKYVRQKNWAAFLGNDVKSIIWSNVCNKKSVFA